MGSIINKIKKCNWTLFFVVACVSFMGAAANANIHDLKSYITLSIGGTLFLGLPFAIITRDNE